MATKDRLQCIRQIVSSQRIERQDVLMRLMAEQGYQCSQPMLSRDLRQLRISKVRRRDGSCVYALPTEGQYIDVPTREDLDNSLWKVQFSGQLMVIHTPPGHASMVAYEIDSALDAAFIGTVAGDDTVLVVIAEGIDRDTALNRIVHIVPKLKK